MSDLTKHPLYNRSHASDAALIEACGRVFASAHARSEYNNIEVRNQNAAASVDVFLDTLVKVTTPE